MSYLRVWRYHVASGHETAFQSAYGSDGDWARLFRLADGYLGTELLRATPAGATWITIDRWRAETDWNLFLENHAVAYRELDHRLASLTVENTSVGNYESQTGRAF